jgi:hypothetical protein
MGRNGKKGKTIIQNKKTKKRSNNNNNKEAERVRVERMRNEAGLPLSILSRAI